MLLASLPHGDAWVRAGQALAAPDTWSNSQLQALVTAHARLIHDYKCAEQHPQHDAPAAPAAAQHAGAMMGAHEHILTACSGYSQLAGYKTDRKHVPHSRGLRKADLMVKDFQLAGIRNLIIDVSMRHGVQ